MSEDPIMSGIKPKDPNAEQKIDLNFDKAEVVFSDLVQINLSAETVSLEFAQRSRVVSNKANVTHSIVLTIPHFLRLAETTQSVAKPIIQKMKKFELKEGG